MFFRRSEHEAIAQKLIERWYLPTINDDGDPVERKLHYSKRDNGGLEKIAFPVKGFLSDNVQTPLDPKKMLEWFAILDHLDYFSNRYPERKLYFETFWTNLEQLYSFDLSIDSPKESETVLKSLKQTTESFFPGSERYFKGLMILLGHRQEVVEDIEKKNLGMSALVKHFNPFLEEPISFRFTRPLSGIEIGSMEILEKRFRKMRSW